MPIIICDINLFDAYQPIYKLKEDGTSELLTYADTDELSKELAAVCYENDSSELRLIGPTDYCYRIAAAIGEIDSTKYSNMTLNIEVNP